MTPSCSVPTISATRVFIEIHSKCARFLHLSFARHCESDLDCLLLASHAINTGSADRGLGYVKVV